VSFALKTIWFQQSKFSLQKNMLPNGPGTPFAERCGQPQAGSLKSFHRMSEVTVVLQAVGRGERQSSDELLPLVYEELRRLATIRLAGQAAGHTLQPTALVHEAWLRLVGGQKQSWENRAHFFGAAAEAMRRILIEHARRKSRLKRGSGQSLLDIADLDVMAAMPDDKVLLVDEALEQLKLEDAEKAKIVMLKFFAGLTNEQAAEILNVNERTVRRQWEFAKAWLFDRIRGDL